MKKISLKAAKREIVGRKVKKLRREHKVPANVFGKNIKSMAITLGHDEFKKVYDEAGETGLVDLAVDSKIHPVLIKNLQLHPVSGNILHVDFYEVDLKEKVSANVPLKLAGESPAVSGKLGVLLELAGEVEVEALPTDLPEFIEVNLVSLNNVGDTIKVSDLKIPGGVTVLTAMDTEVVKIAELVSKEAEAQVKQEAEAAAAAAQPTEAEKAPQAEKEAQQVQPAPQKAAEEPIKKS